MTNIVDNTNPSKGAPQTGVINPSFVAGDINLATQIAGEEQTSSTFGSQIRGTKDWDIFTMAAGTAEQLVLTGNVRVGGVIVNAGAVTGSLTLRNAAATGGGSTGIVVAGTSTDMEGARFPLGLTVQAVTTGAGVTVLFRQGQFA